MSQIRTLTGRGLTSYSLKALLDAYPAAASEDLASIYYRMGETVTIEPLVMQGFATPAAQTITLASTVEEVIAAELSSEPMLRFAYISTTAGEDGADDSSLADEQSSSSDYSSASSGLTGLGDAPDSGIGAGYGPLLVAGGVVVMLVGGVVVVVRQLRGQR